MGISEPRRLCGGERDGCGWRILSAVGAKVQHRKLDLRLRTCSRWIGRRRGD